MTKLKGKTHRATQSALAAGALGILLTFQNCAPVKFSGSTPAVTASTDGNPTGGDGTGTINGTNGGDGSGSIVSPTDVTNSIKAFKPSLAVRGLQCILCHAKFESNLITDFGYGSPQFDSQFNGSPSFFANDGVYGNSRGSWQTASIKGTVTVPKATFSLDLAKRVFGDNPPLSFKEALTNKSVGPYNSPMASGIVPPAGSEAVIERKNIVISYPTESEVIAIVPAANQSDPVYVGLSNNAEAGSSVSGLAIDASGKFVRNTGPVNCKGDVVIKGTLFLNNLELTTDTSGCRLYVSQSVFVQGAIRQSGAGANLQVSSARGIMMGFSAKRLGSTPTGRQSNDADPAFNGSPGGPYLRLSKAIDVRYEPGTSPDQRGWLQDRICEEAASIGAELVDAGDQAQVANPPPGTSVSNARISVDFTGVLLNARRIDSRYAGSVKGVMIADIAMFLLDNENANAHFIYDPVFDNVPKILPALKRGVFAVSAD